MGAREKQDTTGTNRIFRFSAGASRGGSGVARRGQSRERGPYLMMPAYSGDVLFLPDSPKPFRAGGARDASDSGLSGGPKKIKVMVVDDESTIADTLVEILAAEGFGPKRPRQDMRRSNWRG